jgi:hypothetical protein
LMVAVFFTFTLSGPLPPKQMGVIPGIAVLLDAMLVRLVLIPTLLRVFGHYTWARASGGCTGCSATFASVTPNARRSGARRQAGLAHASRPVERSASGRARRAASPWVTVVIREARGHPRGRVRRPGAGDASL